MSSGKLTSGFGKFVLSFVRTFPELVMALLFIKAVGPGSFAGVLALGLHSIGMLGKLYSEGIENIDKGPTEALLRQEQIVFKYFGMRCYRKCYQIFYRIRYTDLKLMYDPLRF